jgi:predicted negative regulator of RcsB-dependent stress response
MEADTTVTLYNIYGGLHTNRKRVLAGAVVVVVVAAIVGIVMWNKTQKEAEANQALLTTPSLIAAAAPGDSPTAKALLDVSQKYPGTSAGVAAGLLAAKQLFLDGKFAEAQQEFTKFAADHSGNPLVPQADVGIAACLEARGNTGDAVNQYKKVNAIYAGLPSVVVPVKLTLGRLSEADNKPTQAITYYKELININDPNDPWVREAYERFQLLVSKHPELNPAPPAGAGAAAPSALLTPSAAEMQVAAPPAGAGAAPKPAAPPATNQTPKPGAPATNSAPAAK